MRAELKFHIDEEVLLPYDLNYSISSFIYHCIGQSAPYLASWLHNTGLQYKGKAYKPFVFSRCDFTSRVNLHSGMKVRGMLSFQIDSIMPEIIHHFIEGVWMLGHLRLLDFSFPLQQVDLLQVDFSETMIYKSLSPIVVPIQINSKVIFCHPLDSRFYDSMRNSLKKWYYLRWQEEFPEEEAIHIRLFRPERFQLEKTAVLTRYKEKKIKGYLIPLEIDAPVKMQQVIYEAGLGSYSSQGFGCVSILNDFH
ncbi:CRISPR-associated endoribonuclease Cas6 [Lihuaxuella thermophila]|uniref:CRISPR-associated endoribonuclease n=1 Tax=Lihuaxuella thermophila TaxID=1173111 RepID=A0A1H8D6L3_9BACL|nr:CRISPR-associated endoribonuclease Cas6 [Lihuaxuella thermophila]SEN02775.1 CRISPR-associated endoribonuclease Cas6 [Lihuaxuella thermophila]